MFINNLMVLLPIFILVAAIYIHYSLIKPDDIFATKDLDQLSNEEIILGYLHDLVSIRMAKTASLMVFGICALASSGIIILYGFDTAILKNDIDFKYVPSVLILTALLLLSWTYYRFLSIKYIDVCEILEPLDKNNAVDNVLDAAIDDNKEAKK